MLQRSGLLGELEESLDPQDQGRVENLQELVSVAREYTERVEAAGRGGRRRQVATLAGFLEQVALVADADQVPDDDPEHQGVVTLMTLHTAKGLEFPVVFLTGLEDGVFPHMRALGDNTELEEERRLAYVGHHPRPPAALPVPGGHPGRLGPAAVQPAVPLHRRAAARAGPLGAHGGVVHVVVGHRRRGGRPVGGDRARGGGFAGGTPKAQQLAEPARHRRAASWPRRASCRRRRRSRPATGSTTSGTAWAGCVAVEGQGPGARAQIDFGDQVMWLVLRHAPIEKM